MGKKNWYFITVNFEDKKHKWKKTGTNKMYKKLPIVPKSAYNEL